MVEGFVRAVLVWCAGALALVCSPAAAQPHFPAGSTCYASVSAEAEYSRIAALSGAWSCDKGEWSIGRERSIIRFDLRGHHRPSPDAFAARLTRFDRMRLTVIGKDGRSVSREAGPGDMAFATSDWVMRTALPVLDGTGEAEAVVVEVDRPRHLGMMTEARLASGDPDSAASINLELLIAALCGMLCLPLVFNVAFYRVLRERFVLWHAVAVTFMLAHTFAASGIVNRFFDLSLLQLSMLSAYCWAGGIVAAGLFIADLVEPDKLDPVQKRMLRLLALWVPAWTTFYLFADGIFRPWSAPVYLLSFLPVLLLFVWVMATGWKRHSRAMYFQVAAWTPLMVTGSIRMVSATGLFGRPLEMQFEQHAALALEIIITSLAVADRFMNIRRQRDRAIAQTRSLEELAERDPLTGLYNRHGIEQRFRDLDELGFDTMAVIDLDHFKQVNDSHGHTVGDEVLRVTAEALMPDDDTLAVRMGGEEFLLLLRGKDAANRAERRRLAISTRVARELPALDRVVTASMGLVEQPADRRVKSDFTTLYGHCDRLLYEAKRNGRNRTMSERMQSFARRPRDRRQAA
jgi:diguanylate cyclase (GGDEF)-like protein